MIKQLIKYTHVSHYTIHTAVIFAWENLLTYVFEDEETLLASILFGC